MRWSIGITFALCGMACTNPIGQFSGNGAHTATNEGAPSRHQAGSLQALQHRLVAVDFGTSWLIQHGESEARRKIVRAAGIWRHRFEACGDDNCRRAVLSDQLNRIDYADGRNAAPVRGMPWSIGRFDIRMSSDESAPSRIEGAISLFPVVDDTLLVQIDTADMPHARSICDLVAEGRIVRGNAIELRLLDDSRRRFVLRPAGHGRWSIVSPDPEEHGLCGAYVSLLGTYDVQPARVPIGVASGHHPEQ